MQENDIYDKEKRYDKKHKDNKVFYAEIYKFMTILYDVMQKETIYCKNNPMRSCFKMPC